MAIALVITAKGEISGAFDEGRVTERLMIAARLLGLGAGTAWFGDDKPAGRRQGAARYSRRGDRPLDGRHRASGGGRAFDKRWPQGPH